MQGFSTALAGNTLLLSYFLGKGERAAALVQTIGAVSNFVMLTQVPRCLMHMFRACGSSADSDASHAKQLMTLTPPFACAPQCCPCTEPGSTLPALNRTAKCPATPVNDSCRGMSPQIFISGYMPQAAFAAVVAVVAAAAAVNGAKATGRLDASQGGRDAWQLWQECLGLFGLVLLPQALLISFAFALGMHACMLAMTVMVTADMPRPRFSTLSTIMCRST